DRSASSRQSAFSHHVAVFRRRSKPARMQPAGACGSSAAKIVLLIPSQLRSNCAFALKSACNRWYTGVMNESGVQKELHALCYVDFTARFELALGSTQVRESSKQKLAAPVHPRFS